MVNHGVSRGCETCKKRRKKCDETRPVCKACARGKRHCFGYKSDADLLFRHYQSERTSQPSPVSQTSRSPISTAEKAHQSPNCMSDGELDGLALEFFVRDFCILPRDPSLSRGYLSDVAARIDAGDQNGAVLNAARILSLDNLGQRFDRPTLRRRAQWLYQTELKAFQERVADEATARSTESLMVTTLFGLYELFSTPFPEESEHKVHALGITAILRTFNSPMGLLADVINNCTTSLLKKRLLTPPRATGKAQSLDDLALITTPAMWQYRQLFDHGGKPVAPEADLRDLFLQAEDSFKYLGGWLDHQDASMQRRCVGVAGEREIKGPHGALFWEGPVDIYYDHWVAGVWAVWRKGMIALASIAMQCAKAVPSDPDLLARASALRTQTRPLVKGVLSSLPFFLLTDVQSIFQSGAEPRPGPPVGGLMIIESLYLILIKDGIVSEGEAAYMRRCLDCMGDYQGLGQAKVLSGATDVRPKLSIEDAHTIIWVGIAL